jgi:uncharacterized protein YbjT (DUF2867 family)
VCDLETAPVADVTAHLHGADAAVFAADADIRARVGLDWTILRPGRLTDDPGTGMVTLAESTGRGDVTRDDVAAVLVALLAEPGSAGRTLDLIGGDTPVADAVHAVA